MPQNKNLIDFFVQHLGKGKKVCEIENEKEVLYDNIYDHARSRGTDFYEHDQKVVTVILPNSTEYIEYLLAVLMTNNVFNPVPYFTGIQEFKKILSYITPSFIVTDRRDIIETFRENYHIIDATRPCGDLKVSPKSINDALPASLYYSSGTTGNPKGVLYSHKNMMSLITSIIRGFGFSKEDRQLALLPFGHTASINYNILPSLTIGSDLYVSKGFESLRSGFFEVLARHKINYTQIVPTILLMLLKLNVDVSKYDLTALRYIGCGSSTLPLISQKEFIEKYNIKITNLYGLSETGPSHIDNPLEPGWEPQSIGIPLDVNECRISQDGEILLRGDNVFIGYYKNEKLYHEVVKNGWFHTGDLGEEKGGKFYFVDRKKDLIIKGGINIVPMEIEEVLYNHPNVHECVVVGKNNHLYEEELIAVVVPKTKVDEKTFKRKLKVFCKAKLSNYKVPSNILFWEKLPKTPSHKLLRRTVREIINTQE